MKNIYSLLEIMQRPELYKTNLKIWADEKGLLMGLVTTDDLLLFRSRKHQFIEEVLEELDELAEIKLDKWRNA